MLAFDPFGSDVSLIWNRFDLISAVGLICLCSLDPSISPSSSSSIHKTTIQSIRNSFNSFIHPPFLSFFLSNKHSILISFIRSSLPLLSQLVFIAQKPPECAANRLPHTSCTLSIFLFLLLVLLFLLVFLVLLLLFLILQKRGIHHRRHF